MTYGMPVYWLAPRYLDTGPILISCWTDMNLLVGPI